MTVCRDSEDSDEFGYNSLDQRCLRFVNVHTHFPEASNDSSQSDYGSYSRN